ncbi:hypothetical protein P9VFCI_159 [Rhizobium phage P9VFCI]|uniref:Uncharacterized protein n=1 Tax=Rhizobium phage P9VFCI TaxID=2763531 RepID=A0A7G7WXI4_9CAUD|nr:hypothetical protein PP937_gp159 [Rhizobium phage P9VFCI]QNH71928.1 hypothetical protein P9VFCI_159 [Rhizobium phage P9VFCI]
MNSEIRVYQNKEEWTNFIVTKGPLLISFNDLRAATVEADLFKPEILYGSFEEFIGDLKNWNKIEPTRELFESFFVDVMKFILFKDEFESLGFILPMRAIYNGDLK